MKIFINHEIEKQQDIKNEIIKLLNKVDDNILKLKELQKGINNEK